MQWVKIKRTNISADEPCVSIKNERFYFNVAFSRLAQIEQHSFVSIYTDDQDRCIGFEFKRERTSDDEYRICGDIKKGFYCQCKEAAHKVWVASVRANNKRNKFLVSRDKTKWFIRLMPAFEVKVARDEYKKINTSASGIYRYIDDSGQVVYIGKGNIRSRLLESERAAWNFCSVEYSLVADDSSACEWESFWIQKHINENYQLPIYNQIGGRSIEG